MVFFGSYKKIEVRLQSPGRTYRRTFGVRALHAILWPPYVVGLALVTVVAGVFWVVSFLCHAVGLMVLWPPRTIARTVVRVWRWLLLDVEETIQNAPRRSRRFSEPQFAYGLLLFCVMAGSVFGLLKVGNLLAEGLHLKGQVLGQATLALSKLSQGKDRLEAENLEDAQSRFALAMNEFRSGSEALGTSNILVKTLVGTLPAGRDAQNLLLAGEAGSRAAVQMTTVLSDLKSVSINETGVHTGAKSMADISAEFETAKQSVTVAANAIRSVSPESVPLDKRQQFEKVQGQLGGLAVGLDTLSSGFKILLALTSGNKHVLVLLQNSNELRPTGGFLGTFGAFDLASGVVQKQTISSIYDLDGQLQTKYVPPLPLFAVNNRWFLRDANWFASFPESAETIIGFYEEEAHKTPDIVVAITPQVATRLLALTGPVALPAYGVSLDADNFIETTQVETSLYYDKAENKPKKMLSDFFPALLHKISTLPPSELPRLLGALTESLASKDVVFYARDGSLQQTFSALGFDGRISDSSRDYVSIVSANLGGTKTDLAMEQQVSLDSQIELDGSITNTLTILRHNPLPQVKGLENKDFMRVYVPLGSKLVSSKGFTYVDLDAKYGATGTVHPKVATWESATVKAVDSGMLVGEEAGKTFFGNWVSLEGGQRQTLELVYRLPYKLDAMDRQSLIVQKQPGALPYEFSYTVNIPGRKLLWATDETTAAASLVKKFDITRDRYFGTVLQMAE